MPQLWLLRHGEAEPHDARPDAERRLTERGEQQSNRAGAALAAIGVTFQAIWTSPKVRARDTARLAAEAMAGPEPLEDPRLVSLDARTARELLGAEGADARILLVGHEPDLSQVVHDLTGARADFKKGGLAGIALDGARGELLALLRPRDIAAMR